MTQRTQLLKKSVTPITNSLSGLYQLTLSKDTKKLVFSTLYESVFNLFMLDNPFEPKTESDTLSPTLYFSKLEELRASKKSKTNIDEKEMEVVEETVIFR